MLRSVSRMRCVATRRTPAAPSRTAASRSGARRPYAATSCAPRLAGARCGAALSRPAASGRSGNCADSAGRSTESPVNRVSGNRAINSDSRTVLRRIRCSPEGRVVVSSTDEQRPSSRGRIWSAQRLVSSFDQPYMSHVSDAPGTERNARAPSWSCQRCQSAEHVQTP